MPRLLLVAAAALCALAPATSLAQADPSAEADSPARTALAAEPLCSYDVCALRVEPGFWGARLVQGRDGATIDREWLIGGMDLAGAVSDAPRARAHADQYADARFQVLLASAGTVALVTSLEYTGSTPEGRAGIGFAALGLSIYAAVQAVRAQREQSRAVWEYNATLGR